MDKDQEALREVLTEDELIGVALVPMTKGVFALIDPEDAPAICQHKWVFSTEGYAIRMTPRADKGKRRCIIMHREILNAPDGLQVDHINGNRLDNRKSNLRLATKAQNQHNSRLRGGTSLFKGVHWSKRDRKWVSGIVVNGEKVSLGNYRNEVRAAMAYNIAAADNFGLYARLNPILPQHIHLNPKESNDE